MLNLVNIQQRMSNLKDWALEGSAIMKEFNFSSFNESIEFTNKVAEISKKQEHHPEIIINCDSVRLILTTINENGLTEKDFDVAEEIDKI